MPLTEQARAEKRLVWKQSALIGLVLGPGWFLDKHLFEVSIVSTGFAAQVNITSLALFGLLGFYLVVTQYRTRMRERPPPQKSQELERGFLRLLVFVAFSQAVSGYVQGLYVVGRYLVQDVLPRLPSPSAAVVGVGVTALVGVTLFLLRLKARFLYASLELLTSLALAAHLAPKFQANDPVNLPFLLTFVPAAIYLFVRGADNMHQALTKEEDLFLKAISSVTKSAQKLWRRASKRDEG